MLVFWLHNTASRNGGMFMWDILDRLRTLPGIEIQDTPIPVVRNFSKFWKAVTFKHAFEQTHCVHAQYGSLVSVVASLQRSHCHLVSLRGSDIYWKYGNFRSKISGLARIFLSWFGTVRSDGAIVMSMAMRERVTQWPLMSSVPVHVIPDPAGEQFWPDIARDISKSLMAAPFRVLIASLHADNPVKRIHLVRDAASLCQSVGLNVTLRALSGQGRDAVKASLMESDCVALSSTHEGWPNIVKEGLLMDTPFVSTNVGDLQLYADKLGLNQVVPANPLDFACAWIDVMAAQHLAEYGISANLAQFHPDVVALKHLLLYAHYGKK
jgi:hypothetical protein